VNHSLRVKTTPVILISGDFVPYGGMDAGNWALARHLATDPTLELHLVAHRIHDDLAAQPAVRFHRVIKPLGSYFLGFPCIAARGQRLIRQLAPRGVRSFVNGANCPGRDVSWVHYLHASHTPVPAGRLTARAFASLHHALYRSCERRWLPENHLLFANSLRTKKDILHHYPMDENRIQVVYYGSDPDRFHPAKNQERLALRQELGLRTEEPVAIFIGALGDRRKGFDMLYEAWRVLSATPDFNLNLWVVGAGKDADHWKTRSAAEGLSGRIHFLGFRKDVERLLRAADLMIHPARYEAYGLAVQEALCCGVPVILSKDAGVAERLSPELTPLLMDPTDGSHSIVRAVIRWKSDRIQLQECTSRLANELRAWTWDLMAGLITRAWIPGSAHPNTATGA